MDARPEVSEYGSVDPAPASDSEQLDPFAKHTSR